MSLIAIIDYDMGNIRSVQKACEYLGYTTKLVHEPAELAIADQAILPGVGAFSDAMLELKRKGFDQAIQAYAASGKPLLGICLGMQLFFESSTEGTEQCVGLGLLPGSIKRFPENLPVKIPHIGWNEVVISQKNSRLFSQLPARFSAYFVHSYRFDLTKAPFAIGLTQHGEDFVSAIEKGNVMATQFHPEKSGTVGLKILENFLQREV